MRVSYTYVDPYELSKAAMPLECMQAGQASMCGSGVTSAAF